MAKVIYNDLSEELKKKIGWGVPPGRDEVIEFQLLNIPLVKQNGVMAPVYGYKRIPNTDKIYDPYAKGGPREVEIAYVVNELKNTETKPKDGLEEVEFTTANKNTITISGRDTSKYNLLWYLRAHSVNQSNPLAQPSTYGFQFKELEPKKTAKQKLKEFNELNSCVNYINDMKEADVVAMLSALKQRVMPSPEENLVAMITFVQTKANRDKFNSLSKDVRTPIAALIAKATELELIRYEEDPKTWIYVSTKKIITQVAPQSDKIEHLLEYFHNNTNGKAFKEFLEKEIESMNANEAKKDAEKDLGKLDKKK